MERSGQCAEERRTPFSKATLHRRPHDVSLDVRRAKLVFQHRDDRVGPELLARATAQKRGERPSARRLFTGRPHDVSLDVRRAELVFEHRDDRVGPELLARATTQKRGERPLVRRLLHRQTL